MKIVVMDAQGAGIGKTIIKALRKTFENKVEIVVLATNPTAYQNMMEAGGDKGGYGEKVITTYLQKGTFDALIGPIGILSSGGIQGEVTPVISRLIFEADCKKYIIPLQLHGLIIPGTLDMKIKDAIDEIIQHIQAAF